MGNVQKKISNLIKECYCAEETKIDSDLINFFDTEAKSIEEQAIYIHPKGLGENLMNEFY
jgi:hypothetical protein